MRQRSRHIGTGVFFVMEEIAPAPRKVRKLPSQASADAPSTAPMSPPRDYPLLTWHDSSEPSPPPPTVHKRSPTDVSVVQNTRDTTKCIPRPIDSSFTVLPSIHFQAIPRPLRPPFSLIPPEHVQVSGVAHSDLDMTLYVFFPVS